jgi:glycosyltransferase involved in cell wall biosynthesis
MVTVAIPTFNRASLLERCIDAVLLQTYPNFEIVVCDNASSDSTPEVLAGFDDPKLRVIRHPTNIGLLPNWNACVAAARGSHLVVLSDDDTVEPSLLERTMAVVTKAPQAPVVIALCDLHHGSTGRTVRARTSPRLQTGLCDGTDILLAYLRDEIGIVATCGIVFRTEDLRANGGFPLQFPHAADVAAWAPLLFLGQAGFVNKACATWCSHDASETARLGVEQRLRDQWGVTNLISDLADRHIADPSKRRTIQFAARRCFAGRGLSALSQYRQSGGRIQAILGLIWQFRFQISSVKASAALKLIGVVACPRPLANQMRRLGMI